MRIRPLCRAAFRHRAARPERTHLVLPHPSLGQYRWDPIPHADEKLTWVTGMRTVTTAGDVNTQTGMASHVYLVTESMVDEYFYSADGELAHQPK
ncbi:MAG TPA: homogentisate 1,2-dioxygenase [Ensifer sp.]|nr:homogentisate 1,2-dioxygenase [Ensifer sp.]